MIEIDFGMEWGWMYVRASLFVLVIGIGSTVEQKLGAIGVTERDGVKEGGASVGVQQIHFGSAQGHQSFQAVAVPTTGRAVQSCKPRPVPFQTNRKK
jgi:hypothetical protein